jgi:hypothetical protein
MSSCSQKQGTFWPASCVVHCQQEENDYSSMWYIYQTKLHGWHLNPSWTLSHGQKKYELQLFKQVTCSHTLPTIIGLFSYVITGNKPKKQREHECMWREEGRWPGSYLEMLWSGIKVTTSVSIWCQSAEHCCRHFITKVVLFTQPFDLEAISLFQQTLRHTLLLTG